MKLRNFNVYFFSFSYEVKFFKRSARLIYYIVSLFVLRTKNNKHNNSDNSKLVICVFNTNTNVINQELFLASIGMLNCQTFAAVFIVLAAYSS